MHALAFFRQPKKMVAWMRFWSQRLCMPQDEEALAQLSTAFSRSYCWHSEILDESGIELKYLLRNLG
jgi:hypothetical protein